MSLFTISLIEVFFQCVSSVRSVLITAVWDVFAQQSHRERIGKLGSLNRQRRHAVRQYIIIRANFKEGIAVLTGCVIFFYLVLT